MSELSQPMPGRGPHLKLALCFGVAGVIATLLLFPYLLAMMPLKFAMLRQPWWIVMLLQSAQSGVLCLLLGWLGLVLGTRYGLDAPWLRAWVYRQPRDPAARPHWFIGLALGMLAGWLVIAISRLLPHPAATAAAPSMGWAWRGALASFYGGFVEEVECRLFLASLFVWLLARLNRRRARPWTFVAAIALAALLFGAGHLPAAFAAGMKPAFLPISRIILLNALVGAVTGGLFWKWGLEHAMLAHFGADLVLHVAWPLAGSL
ncbi:membrane protease YdiL (CAAX protease family) [Rhodanobacter sp. K2T2]|uniref:CPBP family glutamic-type intramembrane protease n=1 Tax=Rhodanobacter sp. K2T2 TaxID=2723085 RepID=UPI0015C9D47E|nr:CPBP family glutamic-type intramembrane protease [Rhodanobacter sp. K2T2]NYE27969.1 membrane protease YdiL (CAAX protease family) [Rhodanobacter sp. K2T2]